MSSVPRQGSIISRRLVTSIYLALLVIALAGVFLAPSNLVLFLAIFTAILLVLPMFLSDNLRRSSKRPIAMWMAWLQRQLTILTTRPLRNYYKYVIYEHQVFDVKGLSTRTIHDLDLEQIFVELSVDPKPIHQTTADPLKVPEPLREGSHTIWDYLSSSQLEGQPIVIVGAPGCGKTTLLKHLAMVLARHKKLQERMRQTVPILLYLREHARSISDNPSFSLLDAVQNHVERWQRSQSLQWLPRFLKLGRCLILLDGLDEIANEDFRKKAVAWVQQQIARYGQNNRFLITSRPYGYRTNPLDDAILLDVRLFTAQQTERFVHNWYLANELKSWGKDDPGVHIRAKAGALDLLRRLHRNPALLALAVNPLLLTMIATVHRYRSSLPGSRVALYAEICEVFLGRRQQARSIAQELNAAQKQYVLRPLAYYLMEQGKREVTLSEMSEIIQPYITHVRSALSPQEFVSMVENTSGLLLERDPGRYGFAHLTFQEYLASIHIKENDLEPTLIKQVDKSWWHETIRLYCAQEDASEIISTCLSHKPSSVQTLILALECYEEALLIDPHIREQVKTLLETGVEDPDPERRHVIADALLDQRLNRMIQLHDETYIDTSLITCAEYQLFLDEQRVLGEFYQPDHWLTNTFPQGQGHTPVLGVRPSDATAFCRWLTERDKKGWSYRLPTTAEHTQLEKDLSLAPNLIPDRKKERGYWIDEGSSFAWMGDRQASFDNARQMIQAQVEVDLAHAHTHASDLARKLVHAPLPDLSLDRTLDRAHALDHNLFWDPNFALAFNYEIDSDFAWALDPTPDRALARAFDYDLADDLIFALSRKPDISSQTHEDQDKNFRSTRARATALVLTSLFDYWAIRTGKLPSRRRTWMSRLLERKQATSQRRFFLEHLSNSYFELYISLVLLKLRTEGKIPPWEGFLLVKERL